MRAENGRGFCCFLYRFEPGEWALSLLGEGGLNARFGQSGRASSIAPLFRLTANRKGQRQRLPFLPFQHFTALDMDKSRSQNIALYLPKGLLPFRLQSIRLSASAPRK